MKPLRIAFLWHQHQPYYKWEDSFILPWVRFHGVKDYFDLPALIEMFPNLKQTFNFAPSLMVQIEDYISGNTKDRVMILTEKKASLLNDSEKEEIIKQFFVINFENLIKPNKRYLELFKKAEENNCDISSFDNQDWLDLQVWYNLAWIGEISKENFFVKNLIQKNRSFTEEDKVELIKHHLEILKNISKMMNKLEEKGQVEISCSPEYHPILPILIDSSSSLEAMPWLDLEGLEYRYPEDAAAQIRRGIDIYKNTFGKSARGVWPSEGSLSDETLKMLADNGIEWVATDEEMLRRTAGDNYYEEMKFFPHVFQKDGKEISLLFRDHFLSDRIGFVYSNWSAEDAASDFCSHLEKIRSEIILRHTEGALENAVVTVILDGENCWEFYPENGFPFLKQLFAKLSDSPQFETITCSEAVSNRDMYHTKYFNHIHSGSWINANFSIWIGHRHDILAWKMLSKIRNEVEARRQHLDGDVLAEIMNEIYIAEGSDWFWWYGPEHNAPNKPDFDVLFRKHIGKIYELLGLDVPIDVGIPIGSNLEFRRFTPAQKRIAPSLNAKHSENDEWANAAVIATSGGMSTMHKIGEIVNHVKIGNDDDYLYIRIELNKPIDVNDEVQLSINNDLIFISQIGFRANSNDTRIARLAIGQTIDIALTCSNVEMYEVGLKTVSSGAEIDYSELFGSKVRYCLIK